VGKKARVREQQHVAPVSSPGAADAEPAEDHPEVEGGEEQVAEAPAEEERS
jgi:hypothetical protein